MKYSKNLFCQVGAMLASVFLSSGIASAAEIQVGGETLNNSQLTNSSETVLYDPVSETLTLNGYTGDGINIVNTINKDITIILKGNNAISADSETSSALKISGTAILKGEKNSKLILSNPSGTVVDHNGLVVEEGTTLEINGKEGISPSRTVFNGGNIAIKTSGTGILIDGAQFAIGDAIVDIQSEKSYGVDLRNESTFTISGGQTSISGDLASIHLLAGIFAPAKAYIAFNNGQTKLSSTYSAIELNYASSTASIANGDGIRLGDGMYIVEDDVVATTKNKTTTLTKGDTTIKEATIKQLSGSTEENSKTGDNVVIYVLFLGALGCLMLAKTRRTSRL